MTRVQGWAMSVVAMVALIVGVMLASGAISFAQESSPTPTPAAATASPSPGTGSNMKHGCPNMGQSSSGTQSSSSTPTTGA